MIVFSSISKPKFPDAKALSRLVSCIFIIFWHNSKVNLWEAQLNVEAIFMFRACFFSINGFTLNKQQYSSSIGKQVHWHSHQVFIYSCIESASTLYAISLRKTHATLCGRDINVWEKWINFKKFSNLSFSLIICPYHMHCKMTHTNQVGK